MLNPIDTPFLLSIPKSSEHALGEAISRAGDAAYGIAQVFRAGTMNQQGFKEAVVNGTHATAGLAKQMPRLKALHDQLGIALQSIQNNIVVESKG